MSFPTPAWDAAAFVWINQIATHGFLDMLMPIFSQQAWLWLLLGIVATTILVRVGARGLLPLLCILLAVGTADGSASLLKNHFGRVRPHNALSDVRHRHDKTWVRHDIDLGQAKGRGTSFPSAHAANSMVVAVLLMAWRRESRPWALLLPLLVGYSRIYLGKHYPSDVLAGWLLGLIVAGACRPFLAWACGPSGHKQAVRA